MDTPVVNLDINQKASFSMLLTFADADGVALDISNWGFSGSIKAGFKDTTPITSFNIEPVSSGSIKISLLPSQTALLVKPTYIYDIVALNVTPAPDETYRMLQGEINVSLGVTGPVGP